MAVIVALLGLLFFRTFQRERAAANAEPEPLSPTDRAQLDALVERLAAEVHEPRPKSTFRAELDHPFDTQDSGNGSGDNRFK
jgi:hypothetical protein